MIFFTKRYIETKEPEPVVTSATVTITGSGNSTYCYALINGRKYVTTPASGDLTVNHGDMITFGVYGYSSTYYGRVTIDGTQVLNVTDRTTHTYNWTVPDVVKTISIAMTYNSTTTRINGRITVTTTK